MMLNLLEKIAVALVREYKPKIICITGSVGKTSTKEAIACALSTSFKVRKTSRNYNNHIGVPIAVIGGFESEEGFFALSSMALYGLWQLYVVKRFPEVLVIEVGAGKIGEIERISGWLKPDMVVITNMPDNPSHLGVFKTKEMVMKEKKHLVRAMNSGGTLVIDADESNMEFFSRGFNGNVVCYRGAGILSDCKYELTYREQNNLLYPTGFKMLASIYGRSCGLLFNGFVGTQNLKAVHAGIIVATLLKCGYEKIIKGIQSYRPEAGRLRLIPEDSGKISVIDDSFNASPYAVKNSLKTLISIKVRPDQRKIVVLGDMHNLGEKEIDIHKITATDEIQGVDILITVGNISKIWQQYNSDKCHLNKHFKNSLNAARYLLQIRQEGDIVLFKGGHLTRLEKAVAFITNCAPHFLARQEKYYRTNELDLNPESADYAI